MNLRAKRAGVPLAWLQLTWQKSTLLAALAGISFAVILMLMQLGLEDSLFTSASLLHSVLRADLVQDCGESLNPALDLGQIEGAFVQGQGWLTCEELWWDTKGRLRVSKAQRREILSQISRVKVYCERMR